MVAALTLVASAPCAAGSLAPRRQLEYRVFHSKTSNCTSKKHFLRFSRMSSLIGSGCIWPEPEAEVCTLIFAGWSAE